MTLGLDALEEAYVAAIRTIMTINESVPEAKEHLADGYIEVLQDHLEELRP